MGINVRNKGRNTWFLDVRVRKDGKRLRKRETFTGTRKQAEERYLALRARLSEVSASKCFLTARENPIKTFGQMLNLYKEKKGKFSISHTYRFKRIESELGHIPLEQFADKFEIYIRNLRTYPSKRTGKPLVDSSINRVVEVGKAVMNLALELEIIEKNPITKYRFPRYKETPRDVVLSEDQLSRLMAEIDNHAPYLKPIFKFALQVPCRKSELISMRKSDLDLINNAIRVRNGTTKNDAGCWKPIPPNMVSYFRNLPGETEYLFYRQNPHSGRYYPLGDFKHSWTTCLKRAGIEDFRFHDTRHIAATALLDNGTPERIVQEVAGWKTDMLRTYYHRSGKTSLNLVRFDNPANRVHSGYAYSAKTESNGPF